MTRLEIKKYNIILIEKQAKYQPYHQEKIRKYEYLTGEDILPPNQQAKCTYSPL